MISIAQNLRAVRDKISQASRRVGRDPQEVTLVAVTKTWGADVVRQAIDAGQRVFGENYIQEAKEKIDDIGHNEISWHFIGHLQSNKAKIAASRFDVIETVDSLKLAGELDRCARIDNRKLNVLIQINVGGELQKSGFDPVEFKSLILDINMLESLQVTGLMTMPPFLPPEEVRPYFIQLRQLRDELNAEMPELNLTELSMGLSDDYEVAVEEGATIVRVGTAIFGERTSR